MTGAQDGPVGGALTAERHWPSRKTPAYGMFACWRLPPARESCTTFYHRYRGRISMADHCPENVCPACGRELEERSDGGWYCPEHKKVLTCCEGS